jgi:LuxR family transcriptional regulator, positive regulator of biofilm formation
VGRNQPSKRRREPAKKQKILKPREGGAMIKPRFPYERTVVWIVGQRSMFNDLIERSIRKRNRLNCRLAPSFDELPWRKLNPVNLWIVLFDALNMDKESLESIVKACDSRHNCIKALYNVHVGDQLALEQQAFQLGWQGIFSINIGLDKMIGGVNDLMEGRLWFQREALSKKKIQYQSIGVSAAQCVASLTARERQVLNVIAKGATNEEISDSLNIGLHTVKKHIYNIYQKIKVPNRLQAAIWVMENLSPF